MVAVLAHLALLTALILVPPCYFTPVLPSPSEIIAFVAAPPLPPPLPTTAAGGPCPSSAHEPAKAMAVP
jgi:hypothetical protein